MTNPSLDVQEASEHVADAPAVDVAKAPPDSDLRGGLSFVGLLALWGLCGTAAQLLRVFVGPLAGLVAAVVTTALWLYFGPRPMPGLLHGVMAVGLCLTNVLQAAYCIYLLL